MKPVYRQKSWYVAATLVAALSFGKLAFSQDVPRPEQTVAFNFVDVDLVALTKIISDITGKNFIYNEDLKGKVTINAPAKLTIDEAYKVFISVLEIRGYTVVPSGNVYKIVLFAEAKQMSAGVATDHPSSLNEGYLVRLIRLKYLAANQAYNFVQPLVSRDGYIAFLVPDILLMADSSSNIEKVLSIIEQVDKPDVQDPELVFLKYADAAYVVDTLSSLMVQRFGAGGSANMAGNGIPVARLNAILIFGDAGKKEAMKQTIKLLDVPPPDSSGKINVYFLQYADAEDIQKTLQDIIKAAPANAAGQIIISAHKPTNSLVIVASPSDYQNIAKVIKDLDRKQRQVFVESMVVEASVNKLTALGLKWREAIQINGKDTFVTGFGQINSTDMLSLIQGLSGFTAGGMGRFLTVPITQTAADGTLSTSNITMPGFSALLSLDDFKDAVDILSTPQILTADNKESEIVVGENVPLISQQQTNPTLPLSVFNSIERKDVGITLRITPHITEGNVVRLEVYEEMTAVEQAPANIVTSVGPSLTKRSAKTSISLKDGQTVVIGGLMQEHKEKTIDRVPFLSSIPVIGKLFQYHTESIQKTNLLIFLTPHIISDDKDADEITSNKKKEFSKATQRCNENEIMVKFWDGTQQKDINTILQLEQAHVVTDENRLYQLRFSSSRPVRRELKHFKSYPQVESVIPCDEYEETKL